MLICAVLFYTSAAGTCESGDLRLVFATTQEGRRILTDRDDFVQRLSTFDRSARLQTDQDVSEKAYLQFVSRHVLEWNAAEKKKIGSIFSAIRSRLDAYRQLIPQPIYLIKTTGKEEGGATYTRSNAIAMPQDKIRDTEKELIKLICHECFHLISRKNPELRAQLYASIGFLISNEIVLPADLAPRKITNPDAPIINCAIRLTFKGKPGWFVPIIFSKTKTYEMHRGGTFFNYLNFRFMQVEKTGTAGGDQPSYHAVYPTRLARLKQVSGFFEQVGQNTQYIIHPEEILADNFMLLITGQKDLLSPEIPDKLRFVLDNACRDSETSF